MRSVGTVIRGLCIKVVLMEAIVVPDLEIAVHMVGIL